MLLRIRVLLTLCMVVCCLPIAMAESTKEVEVAIDAVPTAILPFIARGDVDDEAAQVSTLLFAELLSSKAVSLVEREELDAALSELKLSRTGLVSADEAVKLSQMTGAKLLVTGSVMIVDGERHLVAKVMSSETSRVAGAAVKGGLNVAISELVKSLSTKIDNVIATKSSSLLPKAESPDLWMAKAKQRLQGKTLPSVTVHIPEQHLGQQTFDPAAQTEIENVLTQLGFNVIAADHPKAKNADIQIKGEAISQQAMTRSELTSVQCRVEIQVRRQDSGNVIASDSETTVAIDLAEQIAAKSGLQEAANKLIRRSFIKFVQD